MSLLFRVLIGAGLAALGYYVGREVGRVDHVRRDLEARGRPDAGAGSIPRAGAGGGRAASSDAAAGPDVAAGAGGG